MNTNNIVYIDGAYEALETEIDFPLTRLSDSGKLSDTVLEKINSELSFIKENKIALPYIFARKLISYSEEIGYGLLSSKLNIDTPLIAYFMGIIKPHQIFYDYSYQNGKPIELTFSKNIKEKILSFVCALLGKEDYDDVGVKIDFD